MLEQLNPFRSDMLQFLQDCDAILYPPDCFARKPAL